MNFEALSPEIIRLPGDFIDLQAYLMAAMEARATRAAAAAAKRGQQQHGAVNRKKQFPSGYFGVESFLLLLCLAVSLLVLPLVLPPLPPPPALLLLVPVGMLAMLVVLAFTPYDVRDIASSYL